MNKKKIALLTKKLKESGVDVESIENVRQLKWLLAHPEFERYPVDVRTFIRSPKYLHAKSCRKSVEEKMVQIFGDQEYVEKNPKKIMKYEDVVDVEGIGGGKTYSASIFIAYGVYRLLCLKNPQEYYNQSKMSGIYFMLMSTSEKNAKDVIFGEINARINENPNGFFKKHYMPNEKITTQLNFAKNIRVIPGNSSETFFVGYNIFMAVIDECDDHKKTQDKDYVVEGYYAIKRRITSRFLGYGGVMMIGSPKSVNGFMMRMYRKAIHDDNMLGIRKATWEAMDADRFSGKTFKAKDPEGNIREIPIEMKKEWERNPERFWRDLGAVPSAVVEPFITLTHKIDEAFNPELATWDGVGRFPAIQGSGKREYIAHVDLGVNKAANKNNSKLSKDHCGIAVGHIVGSKQIMEYGDQKIERPYIIIDFVARLSSPPEGEIQIADVRRLLFYLRDRGFNFYRVQFDQWQSRDSIQILEKMGIPTKEVSVDRTMYPYEALKEALYENRIEFGMLMVPDERVTEANVKENIIKRELIELKRIEGKKVDHPVDGSKDVADAIAGVVYGLTETKILHKIGIRYKPRFVRDSLNLEKLSYGKTNYPKKRSTSVPKIAKFPTLW